MKINRIKIKNKVNKNLIKISLTSKMNIIENVISKHFNYQFNHNKKPLKQEQNMSLLKIV